MAVSAGCRERALTVPNAISLLRLACVPVFLWLLLGADERVAAAILLAGLGASDWVDGYVARHFDQTSDLGKVLDPVADRVLLAAACAALLATASVPQWVGTVVLAREAAISMAGLGLAAAGARRIEVQWAGKAGTLALMFCLPGFLLTDALAPGAAREAVRVVTWVFTAGGLGLSYYAAASYVPSARRALREGRGDRTTRDAPGGIAA